MSAAEILNELPKLNAGDLELVFRRAAELHRAQILEASPELLAAIDEADEEFAKNGGMSVEEARRTVASWNTK